VAKINNLKIASQCMYSVVRRMPPGIDQVTAAEMCYSYAQEGFRDPEDKFLTEVKNKYSSLFTTRILYEYDLGEADYLHLVEKPLELMPALYQDPSIVARGKGHIGYSPGKLCMHTCVCVCVCQVLFCSAVL
jgi:hypothetical protein